MRSFTLLTIVAVLLAAISGYSQESTVGGLPDAPLFENGILANGTYSNECFGLSLPIPAGWQVNEQITPGGKAKRLSANSVALVYLFEGDAPRTTIVLLASTPDNPSETIQDFISKAVSAQVGRDLPRRQLIRSVFAVEAGAKQFYRSDFKMIWGDGTSLYIAYVYTSFRGYLVGGTVTSPTPEGLDQAVHSLQELSFGADQANPKCTWSATDSPKPENKSGPIGPIQRVRVSQGVSDGLLIGKVQPNYPTEAKQARIQGQVVLKVRIDKNGDVSEVKLVSGHPELAPAAIDAVKQWKYKPYLLNGQPVNVETQVIVNFNLAGG